MANKLVSLLILNLPFREFGAIPLLRLVRHAQQYGSFRVSAW
jgi:hypothetical protein